MSTVELEHPVRSRRRRRPVRVLATVAVAGAATWFLAAPHAGGALADAWEPTSGAFSLVQSQPLSSEASLSVPINPGSAATLRGVDLVGARGVELAGAFVVPGSVSQQVALGWEPVGERAAGAVVGGGDEQSLVLHLRLTDPATARFDGLRLTTREGLFTYRNELATGLRVASPGGC
ncbi:MAG TPA: hypothetical protein VNR62_04010 [Cellulomonas sp.]|nr:hypothetical protein [Cellulomonas sp.]